MNDLVSMCESARAATAEPLSSARDERLDAAVRICLFCIALGATTERSALPYGPATVAGPVDASTDLFRAMALALCQGTFGAAADLDPLDRGPAHLALPAVTAASIAAALAGKGSADIARAVHEGMEVAARVRACVVGVRPGAGFHSVGVFGVIAAASATARIFDLRGAELAHAAGIALTRASGLALNSAATRLGMSHFGWAAAHGLEAGALAQAGMTASLDVATALTTFFPGSDVDVEAGDQEGPIALDRLFFKQYPCNIYLNLLVQALDGASSLEVDRIEVTLPPVRHLDNPRPADVRAARNSAQAVAALAVHRPLVYESFTDGVFDVQGGGALRTAMERTSVVLDTELSSDLATTQVRVQGFAAGVKMLDRVACGSALGPWGLSHANALLDHLDGTEWVDALFTGDYVDAHRVVTEQVLRDPAPQGGRHT